MSQHDFSELYDQFPSIIEQMPNTFTSHQFILELARQNQTAYIEALYYYRHHVHTGKPAPFLMVHATLASQLARYPELIRQVRKDAPSKDIFGQDNQCSEWRKV